MSAEAALVSVLKASAEVVALVGGRIYGVEAGQKTAPPYVVYELTSSVPVESPIDGSETNESVIDVACYGVDYPATKTLAKAVRSAVVTGLAAVLEDENDLRDNETQRKAVVQTYRIWHDETFP